MSPTDLLATAERWCQEHDPSARGFGHTCSYARVAAAATDALHGISPPIISGGALVGDVQSALQADQKVAQHLPAPGSPLSEQSYQRLLQTFRDSPGTGVTTMMDMARIKAGYNPLDSNLDTNAAALDDYIQRLNAAPGFHPVFSKRQTLHREESDWNVAVGALVDLYEGVSSKQKESIRDSLVGMTKAAMSHSNTRNTENLFTQSTIGFSDHIDVFIYSSHIEMVEDVSKGSTSKMTDITIQMERLKFTVDTWPELAEMVMNRHVSLLGSWLDANTTATGDKPARLCIS